MKDESKAFVGRWQRRLFINCGIPDDVILIKSIEDIEDQTERKTVSYLGGASLASRSLIK